MCGGGLLNSFKVYWGASQGSVDLIFQPPVTPMLSKDFDGCSAVLYTCLENRGRSSRREEVNCGTNCGIPLELHLKNGVYKLPRAVVVSLLSWLDSRHSICSIVTGPHLLA